MRFSLHISEGIPSLMRFWLIMTSVLQIWFMQIFARPKKLHEPRTGCILSVFYSTTFHVCLYVLDISKTAAATQTVPGIRDLAVKIILQKLFCFADKFSKLLTLQFNSCYLYNRTVYNRVRVCVKSYL